VALILALTGCADFDRGDPTPDSGSSVVDGGLGSSGQAVSFASQVHPLLSTGCQTCHRSGGIAGGTSFVLSGSVESDLSAATGFIDLSNPSQSRLLRKAAGLGHGGGSVYPESSTEHQTLFSWISGGAQP
jgi:hypothetical protein